MENEKIEKLNRENLYIGFIVLLKYLGKYKKDITILTTIGILSAIGNGFIPYLSGLFLDSIINPFQMEILGHSMRAFVILLFAWSIIQLVTLILDWKINIMSEYLSNTIWLQYISNGFGYLLNLPISFHKKNKIGEIGNKIIRDMER